MTESQCHRIFLTWKGPTRIIWSLFFDRHTLLFQKETLPSLFCMSFLDIKYQYICIEDEGKKSKFFLGLALTYLFKTK